MTLEKLSVILIVLVWTTNSLADNHRSRRSGNEYILHRCTATAELIRKHRNEDIAGISSRKTEEDLAQLQTQQKGSLINATQSEVAKQISSSVYRRMTHMRRRGNGHARRIAAKYLADTPLKTVNINVSQDRPSAFKKKNPLPELARDTSSRKIDSLPHVIIIKSVT
ncbi:uncharacterized protein LOC105837728 [Monomorium pharaonis]|uniref:uncharacterized protein LOC105837728 n=1 Tax=Monomorium pharaonis TaxID=307658 RepID=UPI00063F79BE|nr:uncharacterized protein LOC105837728 [Monomorium pharaonis]